MNAAGLPCGCVPFFTTKGSSKPILLAPETRLRRFAAKASFRSEKNQGFLVARCSEKLEIPQGKPAASRKLARKRNFKTSKLALQAAIFGESFARWHRLHSTGTAGTQSPAA